MIAVFSDIHANSSYLEKALAKASFAEAILCLGDIVGYRKKPEKTVRLVQENCDIALMGNHDAAATGQFDSFFEMIPPWLEETLLEVEEIDDGLFQWLARRPLRAAWGRLQLVHGTLRDPLMEFLAPGEVARSHLARQEERISLVGHTHKALAISVSSDGSQEVFLPTRRQRTLDLATGEKWVLNPGSLGIRGKGQGPSWLEVDLQAGKARWHFLHS